MTSKKILAKSGFLLEFHFIVFEAPNFFLVFLNIIGVVFCGFHLIFHVDTSAYKDFHGVSTSYNEDIHLLSQFDAS